MEEESFNPHSSIVEKYRSRQQLEKVQMEQSEVQASINDGGINPHQAIIARHAARKAERERLEREEKEEQEKCEKQKEMNLKRKATLKQQTEEVQRRQSDLLLNKLETKQATLLRYEGKLSGWKERFIYIEDKEPLVLKIYKQFRADAELIETIHLTSDTILSEEGNVQRSGSSVSVTSVSSFTKTMRPVKYKPNTFVLTIKEYKLRLSTDNNVDSKVEWVNHLQQLLTKHHSSGNFFC